MTMEIKEFVSRNKLLIDNHIRPHTAPYLTLLKGDIIQNKINNATFSGRQRIEILELQIRDHFPNTEYTERIQTILNLTTTEETIQKNKIKILSPIEQAITYKIFELLTIKGLLSQLHTAAVYENNAYLFTYIQLALQDLVSTIPNTGYKNSLATFINRDDQLDLTNKINEARKRIYEIIQKFYTSRKLEQRLIATEQNADILLTILYQRNKEEINNLDKEKKNLLDYFEEKRKNDLYLMKELNKFKAL
ncbi:16184_t:CDS:2 [Gigaspora rosea]|nr:16184_t:CDS:2 [Gigaspora rosea]